MKYTIGDSVRLKVAKQYAGGVTIPAQTPGTIRNTYPVSVSYLVKFNGFAKERRVLEDDLV